MASNDTDDAEALRVEQLRSAIARASGGGRRCLPPEPGVILRVILDGRVVGERFPGISRYTLCLAEALARTGMVALTLLHRPAAAGAVQHLSAAGVALHPVDAAPFSLAEQLHLPAVARRLRPHLWHAPYYAMPYRRLGVPVVLTFYDAAPLVVPGLWPWHRRRAFALAHRLALRAAARVIAVSGSARADLVRYFGVQSEAVAVTRLAAAPWFRPVQASEQARVRRTYGLPERFVLTVGTDKGTKNLDRLTEAIGRAWVADPAAAQVCVIAGAVDPRRSASRARKRFAAKLDAEGSCSVRFLGVVPDADLPALYTSAELFVCPSLHEGFGLPVAEAMACGVPVACSRAASLPEVVGDAGVLFDPCDTDAIAAAIRALTGDSALRADLARRGCERTRARGWDAVARETLAVYRDACRS